jgi:hypothetical protein
MSCILIRCTCTYDKNLEMIQPLVQEYSTLCLDTCSYKVRMFYRSIGSIGQIVMKRAHIGDVSNFDLGDLQKVRKIKNPGIMSCILIRCTYDTNLEMIQPLVQE